jgi:radical SAM superfamily enzyme YgiQ (UPF0313 family)
MRVLLIQPPVEDFYDTPIRTFPLGLAYIAGAARDAGFECSILDCHRVDIKKQLPIPPEFSFITPFYPSADISPFKLFTAYYHFGLSWDVVAEKIRSQRPDVVGISAPFTPYFDTALRVARIAKEVVPQAVTVVGGAHVNSAPENVLACDEIDHIVLGEGERAFVALLRALRDRSALSDVEGIGFKACGSRYLQESGEKAADLDGLIRPAYDLLTMDGYRIGGKKYAMLCTSRGCPQACTFCSTHLTMGTVYRVHSAEHVVQEMEHLYHTYGARVFDIEDDNFTYERKRLLDILMLIKKRFPARDIELKAMNGLALKNLDDEVLDLLRGCGMRELNIALVSHKDALTERLKRPHHTDEFRAVVRRAHARALFITAYLILGLPGDTPEAMCDAILLLAREPVLIGPSIFYPTPATQLYEQLAREGRVCEELFSAYRSSLAPIETDDFSRTDLLSLMRIARVINFMKRSMGPKKFSMRECITKKKKNSRAFMLSALGDGVKRSRVKESLSQEDLGVVLLALLCEERLLYHVKKIKTSAGVDYTFSPAISSPEIVHKAVDELLKTEIMGLARGQT